MPVLEQLTDTQISLYLRKVHTAVHQKLTAMFEASPDDTRLQTMFQSASKSVSEESASEAHGVVMARRLDALLPSQGLKAQDAIMMSLDIGSSATWRVMDYMPEIAESVGFNLMEDRGEDSYPYAVVAARALATMDQPSVERFATLFRHQFARALEDAVLKGKKSVDDIVQTMVTQQSEANGVPVTSTMLADAIERQPEARQSLEFSAMYSGRIALQQVQARMDYMATGAGLPQLEGVRARPVAELDTLYPGLGIG